MADTMQFDLVSPERMLASVEATAVKIPGAEGDMTAMPGHTPVITTLRPGLVSAQGPDGNTDYVVSGGFAEITGTSISVLAERAVPRAEVTQDFLDDLRKEAEAAHAAAEDEEKDAAAKAIADLAHLAEDMV
ncbi:F0F1 ATP synthase subunit epsilon [Pseudoruegeria sp. HB172150]|uniref:F0F1 ATP synthase subunit epsilon n=1 Tax=Pseudoruegeria sp. HB172150 TaxID=2721164 RepID=UPI001555817B|nr:F0F1 ATP synthase subunit epsilon [Pseudoruegeria sp. HB172150]